MPTTLAASTTQHERWERGRRPQPPLRASSRSGAVRARGGALALADAAADQLVPPFSVLAAGAVAGGGLSLLTSRRTIAGLLSRLLAVATIVTQVTYVVSGRRMVGAPRRCTVAGRSTGSRRLEAGGVARVLAEPGSVSSVRTSRNERTPSRVAVILGAPVDDVTMDEAVDESSPSSTTAA